MGPQSTSLRIYFGLGSLWNDGLGFHSLVCSFFSFTLFFCYYYFLLGYELCELTGGSTQAQGMLLISFLKQKLCDPCQIV